MKSTRSKLRAFRAAQAGRENEAVRLWTRMLEIDPRHITALSGIGQCAFRRGDMQAARAAFQRIVDADGSDAQQWIHLALACLNLKDEPAEENAIRMALSRDSMDLVALILRANLLERQGRKHDAAVAYGAVAGVAPPIDQLRPELRPAVAQARRAISTGTTGNWAPSSTAFWTNITRRTRPTTSSGFAIRSTSWSGGRSATTRARRSSISRTSRRSNSSTAPIFRGLIRARGGDRRHPQRVPRGPQDRGRVHPVHHLPATTFRTTSSPSSTIRRAGARSTSTRWAGASTRTRRGARRR